ncbi:uncharacterized protein LOC131955784 [Physella acuta]|uniref:uncharacterized protein LOC131955784 n=1 Tax=Physella acuta TaxID=109671 RepID=UPI0027DCD8CC|nr:uncharacterized protein LOC131955784 [Physella acuta]
MKSLLIALLLLVLCDAQIHFTPDWGNNGKRSLEEDHTERILEDVTASCLQHSDLKFLLQIVHILTSESQRLSACFKELQR